MDDLLPTTLTGPIVQARQDQLAVFDAQNAVVAATGPALDAANSTLSSAQSQAAESAIAAHSALDGYLTAPPTTCGHEADPGDEDDDGGDDVADAASVSGDADHVPSTATTG